MRPISRIAAATMLAAGLVGGNLRADTTFNAGGVTGLAVGVKYTGHTGSFKSTTAGAFTPSNLSGDITSGNFDAYCVSIELSISPPTSLTPTSVQTLNALAGGAGTHFENAASALQGDLGNRLAFLLRDYGGDTSLVGRTAMQLAIWNAIDQNFQYNLTGGTTAQRTAVNDKVALLTNWGTGAGKNGYDANTVYNSNAKFFLTPKPDATQFQNLIGIVPGGADDTHVVPEPSSVAIVLGLIGLGAAGRFRARRKSA